MESMLTTIITYLILCFCSPHMNSDDVVNVPVTQIEIQDPVLLSTLEILIHKRKERMVVPPYVVFRKSNFGNSYIVDMREFFPGYSQDQSRIKYYSVIKGCNVFFMNIPYDNMYKEISEQKTIHLSRFFPFVGAAWSQHFLYIPFENAKILINGLYGE